MNDPLRDVVQALRETTTGEESGSARYTRSRVLAAVRLQKRRRVFNVAFGIPLAAILIGSGAWAASGQSLPIFVQRVSVALGLRQPSAVPTKLVLPKAAGRRAVKPESLPVPSANVEEADASPSEQSEASPSEESDTAANALESELLPEVPPTNESPSFESRNGKRSLESGASARAMLPQPRDNRITEQELKLYETAHRAHFVDKDSVAALAAWNEYLRHAPRGRFAVEANYNRALCLLRLGRNGDARVALARFAGGVYGNYRKTEATALVEQIDRMSR